MKLTRIEIEEIRALVNACKEKLCNQGRWNEAQEYQDIVDKLDELLTAESVIRCKDCKYWYAGENINYCRKFWDDDGEPKLYRCTADDFCSRAERKEE